MWEPADIIASILSLISFFLSINQYYLVQTSWHHCFTDLDEASDDGVERFDVGVHDVGVGAEVVAGVVRAPVVHQDELEAVLDVGDGGLRTAVKVSTGPRIR